MVRAMPTQTWSTPLPRRGPRMRDRVTRPVPRRRAADPHRDARGRSDPGGDTPAGMAGGQDSAERVPGTRGQGEVGPDSALLAGEQAGVEQHLEVVGHHGSGQAQGLSQVAHPRFLTLVRSDERQQRQPSRIGRRLEGAGEVGLSIRKKGRGPAGRSTPGPPVLLADDCVDVAQGNNPTAVGKLRRRVWRRRPASLGGWCRRRPGPTSGAR